MITKKEDIECLKAVVSHLAGLRWAELAEDVHGAREVIEGLEQLLTRFSEELERSARAQDTSQHLRSELYTAARDRDMYRVQVADLEETLIRERKALRNERNVRDHRRNKRILIIASHEAAGKLKNDQISNQARQIERQAAPVEHVYDGIRYRELKAGETWQAGDAFVIVNCILSSEGIDLNLRPIDQTNDTAP